jgi:hypothetical protein
MIDHWEPTIALARLKPSPRWCQMVEMAFQLHFSEFDGWTRHESTVARNLVSVENQLDWSNKEFHSLAVLVLPYEPYQNSIPEDSFHRRLLIFGGRSSCCAVGPD